ncbi:hypothetical protein Ait01nite_023740 [Actinoplanes italicus]|nr:hypothetical protein Ait01nite_023740 [Actinoplanes italicus]
MGGTSAYTSRLTRPSSSLRRRRPLFDIWATSTHVGSDPTRASLSDLALLAGMYVMFAGGQQSRNFSALGTIVAASADRGIGTGVVDMVQSLIRRQVDAGHGDDGFARIIESIRAA